MVESLPKSDDQLDDDEIQALLDNVFQTYGYDFRNYSRGSMKRRIFSALISLRTKSIAELSNLVLKDPNCFREFVSLLTVNVTDMFRDPEFYLRFRNEIVPVLQTYPSLRIWHAGCSTGEEVYSMAILLKETGLYKRSLIYATDINLRALNKAREGIYSADHVQAFTAQYQQSGGREPFSNYYTAHYEAVKIASSLKENIVFSPHNLVTDDVFSEVHVVVCRNVLIYFNRELQRRTLDLFDRSLVRRGFLCLGMKESMELSGMERQYEVVAKKERIYRRLEN